MQVFVVCVYCQASLFKNMLHNFYQYAKTRHAWNFALTMLYLALETPSQEAGVQYSLGNNWSQASKMFEEREHNVVLVERLGHMTLFA